MNKSLKAGILVVILVIPALSFVFLKIFGKNSFSLPYYFPKIDEHGEIVTSKGDTLFSKAPQFSLINQNGDSASFLPGKIQVVYFFFSRCGTICPITSSNLVKVGEIFKKNQDVYFTGISVDPSFDTPEVLFSYRSALGMDKLNFNLLTGDKKYIYDICIKGFKLPVADASEYDKSITNVDEMFIHSDKVLLIDKDGFFRGIYSGTSKEEINRLKVEIKVLLSHES